MRDIDPIAQLRRRLVELGCPPKALRRIVREAAEHFDDLRRAAEAQGLAPAEAAIHAAESFGNPEAIAKRHVEALRKSSWWGRHRVLGFVVIPLLVPILWMTLSLALGCLAGFGVTGLLYGFPLSYDRTLLGAPILFLCGQSATWAGSAALAWFFCRKARNTVVPKRWLLAGCLLLSLQDLLFTYHVTFNETAPYTIMSARLNIPVTAHSILGFPSTEPMSVVNALLPWAVVVSFYWCERRAVKISTAAFMS
jgi:hypothetical protein